MSSNALARPKYLTFCFYVQLSKQNSLLPHLLKLPLVLHDMLFLHSPLFYQLEK